MSAQISPRRQADVGPIRLVGFVVLFVAATSASAESPARPSPEADSAEQQVRGTERAFAATMAERDLEAFASFVADDAIFLSGDESLRGREAIVSGWSSYFEKTDAPFSWQPDRVEVLESGELALSTGPVFGPSGNQVATFTSIWRREPSGTWRIVFDRGCPVCGEP